MAPSMAPTVLRSPLSHSLAVSRGRGLPPESGAKAGVHGFGSSAPLLWCLVLWWVRTVGPHCFCSCFQEPTHRARGVMGRQRGAGRGRTVRGMDAAAEPPRVRALACEACLA
ncbi:hypothetical protein, partial [Stenotrophomonas maltophilia]